MHKSPTEVAESVNSHGSHDVLSSLIVTVVRSHCTLKSTAACAECSDGLRGSSQCIPQSAWSSDRKHEPRRFHCTEYKSTVTSNHQRRMWAIEKVIAARFRF
ncbi:hypothetical protein J6590_060136 [Homalodisca vitripennis]|nr:hypothetical protein J6590_060136 [Homalodisca vitripennis]